MKFGLTAIIVSAFLFIYAYFYNPSLYTIGGILTVSGFVMLELGI